MKNLDDVSISMRAFGDALRALGVTMEQAASAMRDFHVHTWTLPDGRVLTDQEIEDAMPDGVPHEWQRKIRL